MVKPLFVFIPVYRSACRTEHQCASSSSSFDPPPSDLTVMHAIPGLMEAIISGFLNYLLHW